MRLLGIETSCDETAAAVVDQTGEQFSILANIVASQIDIHRQYGGVVPEIAAREHVTAIIPTIDQAFQAAGITPASLDAIAVTTGPGLMTALAIGVETARALGLIWNKPVWPINHMYGHMAAVLQQPDIAFPAVCLIVSGGHTELILLTSRTEYKKIGQTVDDAVGEAYDKVAKMLGLGYPGGPIVSQRALSGMADQFPFPRPMLKSDNLNFSFSGLKTAVLYQLKKVDATAETVINNICASFQQAVIDVLVAKTIAAAQKYQAKSILLAGGVAANRALRQALVTAAGDNYQLALPDLALCTDNAAMIALAGLLLGEQAATQSVELNPNWEL